MNERTNEWMVRETSFITSGWLAY